MTNRANITHSVFLCLQRVGNLHQTFGEKHAYWETGGMNPTHNVAHWYVTPFEGKNGKKHRRSSYYGDPQWRNLGRILSSFSCCADVYHGSKMTVWIRCLRRGKKRNEMKTAVVEAWRICCMFITNCDLILVEFGPKNAVGRSFIGIGIM